MSFSTMMDNATESTVLITMSDLMGDEPLNYPIKGTYKDAREAIAERFGAHPSSIVLFSKTIETRPLENGKIRKREFTKEIDYTKPVKYEPNETIKAVRYFEFEEVFPCEDEDTLEEKEGEELSNTKLKFDVKSTLSTQMCTSLLPCIERFGGSWNKTIDFVSHVLGDDFNDITKSITVIPIVTKEDVCRRFLDITRLVLDKFRGKSIYKDAFTRCCKCGPSEMPTFCYTFPPLAIDDNAFNNNSDSCKCNQNVYLCHDCLIHSCWDTFQKSGRERTKMTHFYCVCSATRSISELLIPKLYPQEDAMTLSLNDEPMPCE